MSDIISYSLELLIDGTHISCDALKKSVAKALRRHVSTVHWELTPTTSQHFKLFIGGSLQDVDACHERLNQDFIDQHSCIRLRDEAGDEIRQQAYPILAHIEQQLRVFINRAMIEVNGFDWWNSMTPFLTDQGIRNGVQQIEERIGKTASALHHPLELTLFEDLIRIVTGSVQYWPTGKLLSADDLLGILSDCSSLEDLQKKLAEKTRKVSLWDEVFARYFDDVDKWKELTKTFTNSVIDVRNKVMHHRPMHLWELRKLQEIRQSLDALLASAAAELPEEKRAEARQVSEEWSRALAELIRSSLPTAGNIVAPFLKQQANLSQMASFILGEATALPTLPVVSDIMGLSLKQQADVSQMVSSILGDATALFTLPAVSDIMGPFLKQQEELLSAFRRQISASDVYPLMKSVRDQQEQVGRAVRDMAQLTASSRIYVGSTDSIRFHRLTCRYVNRILADNLIQFTGRDDAVAKGYVPCDTCKP
jgi:hypothetical protein